VALLSGPVELLLADAADVRDVAGSCGRAAASRVVVGLVEAEVLRVVGRVRALNDDRLDRRGEQLRVVDVRALDLEPERPARALDDQALLRAGLGSVSGIGALFSPPKRALPRQPSAACQRQSRPPSCSHSLSSSAHSCSSTPSLTQR
jgi:hypothetical protein